MEFLGACLEVIEAITLFVSLLRADARRCHVEARVSWELAAAPNSIDPQPQLIRCRVEVCGLGSHFLDPVQFLQTLYASAPSLQQFMQGQAWPPAITPVELVWQRVGDHPSKTCCMVEGLQDSNRLRIKETVQANSTISKSLLSVTLRIFACWKDIEADVLRLFHHLHLLHIINPEMHLKLEVVNAEQGIHSCVEHPREKFKSLPKTPFKLATSLCHYHQPSHQGKLRLFKGDTLSLPCCLGPGTLQLCCAVAAVPHMAVQVGRKIPADSCCSYININLFGPGALPLMQAGSAADLQPSLLANWSHYGITLEASDVVLGPRGPLLVPCLRYRVKPLGTAVLSREQVLQVFIFFEHVCVETGGEEGGGDDQWAQLLKETAALRGNLVSLVSVHSGKFCKAVHSALDKLLCNYAYHAELRRRVERVVPTVSEAVNSIVKYSNNQHFKEQCLRLLQLEGETGDDHDHVKTALVGKLSKLAKLKFGPTIVITHPSNLAQGQATLPHSTSSAVDSELPGSSATGERHGVLLGSSDGGEGRDMLPGSSATGERHGVLLGSSDRGEGCDMLPGSSVTGERHDMLPHSLATGKGHSVLPGRGRGHHPPPGILTGGQDMLPGYATVTMSQGQGSMSGQGLSLRSSQQEAMEDFDALCSVDSIRHGGVTNITADSDTMDANYSDTWEGSNQPCHTMDANTWEETQGSNSSLEILDYTTEHATLPSQDASLWPALPSEIGQCWTQQDATTSSTHTQHLVGTQDATETSTHTQHLVGTQDASTAQHFPGMQDATDTSTQTQHLVGTQDAIATSTQTQHFVGTQDATTTSTAQHFPGMQESTVTQHFVGTQDATTTSTAQHLTEGKLWTEPDLCNINISESDFMWD